LLYCSSPFEVIFFWDWFPDGRGTVLNLPFFGTSYTSFRGWTFWSAPPSLKLIFFCFFHLFFLFFVDPMQRAFPLSSNFGRPYLQNSLTRIESGLFVLCFFEEVRPPLLMGRFVPNQAVITLPPSSKLAPPFFPTHLSFPVFPETFSCSCLVLPFLPLKFFTPFSFP